MITPEQGREMAERCERGKRNAPAELPAPIKAAKAEIIAEKEMHRLFGQWLNMQGFPYLESRMDKASTIAIGFPDFAIFFKTKTVFIEMKSGANKPTEEQTRWMNRLGSEGFHSFAAYSVQDAIRFVTEQFLKG